MQFCRKEDFWNELFTQAMHFSSAVFQIRQEPAENKNEATVVAAIG